MAVFGWTDPKMPAHYIAKANREKLGISGMDKKANKVITSRSKFGQKMPQFQGVVRGYGALGGTRTPTMLLTATSRQRVYQFRHEREG